MSDSEIKTCAREGCENTFEADPAHPRKIYCKPRCRELAERDRRRVVREADEIELDVDQIDDIDALLAERGMKREDWVIVRVVVNKWEMGYVNKAKEPGAHPLRQLKVYLRPRTLAFELIQPAQIERPARPKSVPKRTSDEPKLVFVYGDDQRPGHDPQFEALKLEWLADWQPDLIIDLGDGMDFPTVSTHKEDPSRNWSIQECANSYATWLFQAREVCPDSEFVILADNHVTGRLRDYQMAKARDIYGVHPAEVPGLPEDLEPLWSIPRLLHLEALDITYVAPLNDTHYAESHYEIVPGELVAIHGYRTGKNLGEKFIHDYGCSVIYGHQHGQDVHVTDYRRRGVGQRRRRYGLGVGCGCKIEGGGGFAPGADWQNSALTVSVFPDGTWNWDYLNYEHGKLTWRDLQYTT